jgi:hypothetical protein
MRSTLTIAALSAFSLVIAPRTFIVTGHPSQASDACALLTTAEVSAALGTTVEAGKRVIQSSPRVCGWAPPGGPQIDGKKLTLTLMTLQSFETGKKPAEGIEKTPLTGVGDDAIYIVTKGFGAALNVKKGSSAFQLRVGGFKPDQEKAIEKALAVQVLAKM